MAAPSQRVGSKPKKAFVRNASDPQQVKKASRDEKELIRREQEDIKFLLDSPQGRRFLWKILSDCGIYELSYTENSHHTAFNEGRRSIGLKLLADILDVNAEAYAILIDENREVLDIEEEEPDGEQD